MTDPVLVLTVAASALVIFSFALSKLIPDDYDQTGPRHGRVALARARVQPDPIDHRRID